jgi:two-component system aerobic respiration control sensor histidine kinase ArcB
MKKKLLTSNVGIPTPLKNTSSNSKKKLKAGFKNESPYELNFLATLNKLVTGQTSNKDMMAIEYAKEWHNYYESIIACMPNNVYWLDRDCVLLGGNDNLAKMFGLKSHSDLVGLTYAKMTQYASWTEAQGNIFKQAEIDVMNTGICRLNVEEPSILINGKTKYYISSKIPLHNIKREIIGVVGIFTDITDKKLAEIALKVEKEKAEAASIILRKAKEQAELTLDNIVANMPGHVYWKDKNGVYLGCNNRQAKSLGLHYGYEVIGKTDFDLPWAIDVASTFRENDIYVMKTGKTQIIEENAKISGKKHIVLSQKTPLRNKEKEVVGILGISIDITDRKQFEIDLKEAKEKAEAASKAKTEFLENMRHDIRTPLIGITGFASIISDEVKDPKIKEYVNNLRASSYALLDLLNEILDVVKLNSGKIPILKNKFDLRKRLDDVIKLNQAKAHHKNIDLTFDYDKEIPRYVIGDSTRIHRIVLELIANGLNFTKHGSVKLITQLAKTDNHNIIIKIIVEDTGIGVKPEKQQEIFIQFKRLTSSYEGIYKGTGLGLAIVKQFIDELQGEIYVESKIDMGTKFTCIIPLEKSLLDEELGSEDIITSIGLRKPEVYIIPPQIENINNKQIISTKSHVLVVEDNLIAANVVSNMLFTLDCQIDIAENGKKAIQLAQENEYDLILMDIGLPEIDGYETTQRIRLQELNKGIHTPIIALTAHVDEENKQRCLEVGINAIFTKPLAKDKAEDILNTFILYRKQ